MLFLRYCFDLVCQLFTHYLSRLFVTGLAIEHIASIITAHGVFHIHQRFGHHNSILFGSCRDPIRELYAVSFAVGLYAQ